MNWLVTRFRFQNIFWKNINCFRFWWKTYTKRCTNNYVMSRVKDFLPLHFEVGCFQFQVIIWKTEECRVSTNTALKTWQWKSDFDFVPLLFTLRPVSVVATSCFRYIGPCRWSWLVLDGFSSFLFVLGRFSSFLTLVSTV